MGVELRAASPPILFFGVIGMGVIGDCFLSDLGCSFSLTIVIYIDFFIFKPSLYEIELYITGS